MHIQHYKVTRLISYVNSFFNFDDVPSGAIQKIFMIQGFDREEKGEKKAEVKLKRGGMDIKKSVASWNEERESSKKSGKGQTGKRRDL